MPSVKNGDPQVATLETKVTVLEGEIGDVNTRIGALDTNLNNKMDRMSTALTAEIKGVATALADKNKTPWGILISGAAVVLTVVTLLGNQAIGPLVTELRQLNDVVVPRREIEVRAAFDERRFGELEKSMDKMEERERQAMQSAIGALERENGLLRKGKSD